MGIKVQAHVQNLSDFIEPDVERAGEFQVLANADHPQVVEIWNTVFMEFNAKPMVL
jgi:alanyl-tRNA synthetase